jgi:TonB family protein
MAFRGLLFSKNPETSPAMKAACEIAGLPVEVCSDIFTAIEKGKSRAFSCVITDWADQPEASFLLKRARESAPNRNTVAIAIVDNEPTAAEMRDHRLDFLIYRPISAEEAQAVLAKAGEQMQPLSAQDTAESSGTEGASAGSCVDAVDGDATENGSGNLAVVSLAGNSEENTRDATCKSHEDECQLSGHEERGHAIGMRGACAAALVLAAVFCLWSSRATIEYLSQTPEGSVNVLRESLAALFYVNQSGALPVGSAGSAGQQDAYFSRGTVSPNAQKPSLVLAGTAATLTDARMPIPKAPDFPLPVPVLVHPEVQPVHHERAAIPESMRNSPSIAPPVVVTVNPAQMMPVSTPQFQPAIQQQFSEPVTVSEDAARGLLIQSVSPVYPSEGMAQKLHGPVVLQAVIGRDGSVQDLKIVRGYFILGRAAVAAVKQWRFQPYNFNGHAASIQTTITVNFSYPPG